MRWLALAGGVLVQIVIGGVYAWSLFGRALQAPESMGLSHVLAAVPFETAIGMIFLGASLGGRLQDRSSPRVVALAGTTLYAAGLLVASLAHSAEQYWLLVLGYGLIGGFGLGMAYIVPVALLQKWFPARAAVVTGVAVGGFGFGATLTSPLAQHLIDQAPHDPAGAFRVLGLISLVVGLGGSALLLSPPATRAKEVRDEDFTVAQALRTPQWYLLTGILTIAVIAGIALISMMAGAAVDIAGLDAGAAATAVGVLALFNGGGRIAWAAVAQRVGPLPVLTAILVIEGVALLVLPHTTGIWFLVLAALVYLCYGGAFGTMPSTAGRFFGLTHAGAIYGLMLVGWSLGGVVGPLLASSLVGEAGDYARGFSVIGALAIAGVLLPLVTRQPRPTKR